VHGESSSRVGELIRERYTEFRVSRLTLDPKIGGLSAKMRKPG